MIIKLIFIDYEATGRLQGGFLSGYNLDLGNFDLCMSIEASASDETGDSFDGRYCLVSIQTPLFELIKQQDFYSAVDTVLPNTRTMIEFQHGNVLGLCIPSNCDVNRLIESFNRGG